MPIIMIIVGVIAAVGFGGFFFLQNNSDKTVAIEAPVARIENTTTIDTDATTPPSVKPVTETDSNSAPATPQSSSTPAKPMVTPKPVPAPTPTPAPVVTPKTVYKNGTYTVTASYVAPGRSTHDVIATVKIVDDVVTESRVTYGGDVDVETSNQYQAKFTRSYQSDVVGKKLDNISLSRSGGASLTSNAFNKAVAELKVNAKS